MISIKVVAYSIGVVILISLAVIIAYYTYLNKENSNEKIELNNFDDAEGEKKDIEEEIKIICK